MSRVALDLCGQSPSFKDNMAHVGYIRVSSIGQNPDRQLAGVTLDKVFTDKASAKSIEGRPQFALAMDYLREGDTLHVHSIDRLARNLEELQKIVRELTGQGIAVKFHKENLEFTADQNDAMAKLMLQMMGAFAEFERTLIRERQREGIAKAKAAGRRFGRSKALTEAQVEEIRSRMLSGERKVALAKEYGVSRQTLYSACGS